MCRCTIHENALFSYLSRFHTLFCSLRKKTPRLREVLGDVADNVLELLLEVLAESTLHLDLLEQTGLVALQVGKEVSLPLEDLVDGQVVEVAVDTSEHERHHLVDGHGLVLLLLEQLSETLTTVQGLLGSSVKVGTELGESSNLTVLSQEQLQGTGDLLHGLKLGSGTDTGHRQTDVDGGTDTLVEELSLQEDLAVGDGNDVGRNVGRHVTTLGLDDGQSSQGTTAKLVVHLSGTLQETRVQVEDIAGVGLTSRRTAEQQGHLTVSNGLLGQVVVDHDSVLAVISEVLTDGAARERGKELKRSSLRGGGGDDGTVLHGVVLLKGLDELGDSRPLLTNGNVDTVEMALLVAGVVPPLLVKHGVESDGSLTSLTVTNDQLTLTTADWHHGVDGLETSLHGLVDGLAGQDTGGLDLSTAP